MANKQDLVVKMTINSQDFDAGLNKAKSSMNKMQQQTITVGSVFKKTMGAMAKAAAGLGIAMGATEIAKSFIKSTQTMSDAWNNAMVTAKTSFETFQQAVVLGNGTILSNFRQSIAAAREFAQAMDSYGSAQISNKYARMEYVTPFNEAITKYRDMKASGNKAGMAFAASDMQRYLQAYSDNASVLRQSAMNVVTSKLSAYTGGFVNSNNINKYLDQLYLEIINGVLPPILQDFRNLENERKKGDYFYNQAKASMDEKYGEGWRREAEAMNALANINDETLNEMLGVLQTYDSVRNEINSMRRQMNKVLGGGETTTTTPASETAAMTADQIAEYLRMKLQNDILAGDRAKDSMLLDIEIEDIDIVEDDTDALIEKVKQLDIEWQNNINTMNQYASALGSMASAFSSLSQIAADGSPWQKFMSLLGSVTGEIAGLISTYSSLVAVESVAESIRSGQGIPFPYNLAAMAAAAAAIAGIIASASSTFAGNYAEGGIVGGTSYSGDKLWARVNSGEMILNRSQQAALMNGGGQVRFVIEGSQLKGVLDNYNLIENL